MELFYVQINLVLCMLLICLFIHAFMKGNTKSVTNQLFLWTMGLIGITLILEVVSVLSNGPQHMQWMIWNKLSNMAGFIIAPCIPLLGYLFCREWTVRFEKRYAYYPKVNILLFIPILINTIASVISYNGGQLYRITGENIYERGPFFFILPCVSFFYFIYSLIFIWVRNKKFSRGEILLFSLLFAVPALSTIVQLQYYFYLTTWNSAAFIIIISYIFILNDQVYRDGLTGLENRLSYENYSQKIRRKKLGRIGMIYIDIDNFKMINDRFGHFEGDEAIKSFADLITDSFELPKTRIIRFGGDEFLIITEAQRQEKIDACMEALVQNVNRFNETSKKPYILDFSYGIGRYSDEYEDLNALMNHIDHIMYGNKQKKKNISD